MFTHLRPRPRAAYLVVAALLAATVGLVPGRSTATPTCPADWSERPTLPHEAGETTSLTGIAAISPTDVWAVGSTHTTSGYDVARAEHWSGTAWALSPTVTPAGGGGPASSHLDNVSATASNDVWAVGWSDAVGGLLEHWNGTAWSLVRTYDGELADVHAISPSDVWAVGNRGGGRPPFLVHWDGSVDTIVDLSLPDLYITGRLNGVWASPGDGAWVAGSATRDDSGSVRHEMFAAHWSGSSWDHSVGSIGPSDEEFNAVGGSAPNDVWFVGDRVAPPQSGYQRLASVWRYDASGLGPVIPPSDGTIVDESLTDVEVNSPTDVWAVGRGGDGSGTEDVPLANHWDGDHWSAFGTGAPPGTWATSITSGTGGERWFATGSASQASTYRRCDTGAPVSTTTTTTTTTVASGSGGGGGGGGGGASTSTTTSTTTPTRVRDNGSTQVAASVSDPTPSPGETVEVTAPPKNGFDALDSTRPVAAALVPSSGQPDVTMSAPNLTRKTDGTIDASVVIPPGTPPGVYVLTLTGTDFAGHARVLVVPVVVGAVKTAAFTPLRTMAAGGPVAGQRISGADRYGTAQEIARQTFTNPTVAVVVSGTSPADSLAASYLAGAERAPVLTTPADAIPSGLVDTLRTLQVKGVQVIGGTSAVSDNVLSQLGSAGFVVDRLAGASRYETAAKVATLLPKEAAATVGAGRAAILVSGESFSDALTAGPMSAGVGIPILLTTATQLNADAKAALASLGIKEAVIVGGTNAVSTAVDQELGGLGLGVQRLAGSTRQSTAAVVAYTEVRSMGFDASRVELVAGTSIADGLTGGVRGGHLLAPVLLTDGATLGDSAKTFLSTRASTITSVDVLGGTAAVGDDVLADAVRAATG